MKIMDSKWILKNANNSSIEYFKELIVIKDFNKMKSFDYKESFVSIFYLPIIYKFITIVAILH